MKYKCNHEFNAFDFICYSIAQKNSSWLTCGQSTYSYTSTWKAHRADQSKFTFPEETSPDYFISLSLFNLKYQWYQSAYDFTSKLHHTFFSRKILYNSESMRESLFIILHSASFYKIKLPYLGKFNVLSWIRRIHYNWFFCSTRLSLVPRSNYIM